MQKGKLLNMVEAILGELHEPVIGESASEKKIKTQHSIREERKRSLRILLVEDNLVNRKLAQRLLEKGGYHVKLANNGKEAIEIYTGSPDDFDLIFTDIQMPEMDGLEVTRRIREKGFKDIPIIAMTALAMKGDKEKCIEAGMDDYITKPIRRELVFEVIQRQVFDKEAPG